MTCAYKPYLILSLLLFLAMNILWYQDARADQQTGPPCDRPESWAEEKKEMLKARCELRAASFLKRRQQSDRANAWIQANGKSEIMKRIFRGYGQRLPEQQSSAQSIKWLFRTDKNGDGVEECKEYTFDQQGNLLNSGKEGC